MTFLAAIALLGTMLVLSAVPCASVVLVVSRSATLGFANGAAVCLGIVLADLLFVSLAIFGLGVLAETMGPTFAVLKYIAGGYLLWLGLSLFRSKRKVDFEEAGPSKFSLWASFASGFILTLGDVKAILFYASLFPAFVDMASLRVRDVAVIMIVTILAVGGVKLAYAYAAQRIVSRLQNQKTQKLARFTAGGLMLGAGTYLIMKA